MSWDVADCPVNLELKTIQGPFYILGFLKCGEGDDEELTYYVEIDFENHVFRTQNGQMVYTWAGYDQDGKSDMVSQSITVNAGEFPIAGAVMLPVPKEGLDKLKWWKTGCEKHYFEIRGVDSYTPGQ